MYEREKQQDSHLLTWLYGYWSFLLSIHSHCSIKNNIATFISHIHISNQPLIKTLHHTTFITSIEAKMFTIRYSINQATARTNVSKIIVITNSIHAAKKIFDSSSHLFQIQSVAILEDLHLFFSKDPNNLIEFWECSSHLDWHLHKAVDLEIKAFYLTPSYPSKTSWDYSKKSECDNILYLTSGRWYFKHWMARESNFSTYLMTTQMILNYLTSKGGLSFRHLDNQTHYVCV